MQYQSNWKMIEAMAAVPTVLMPISAVLDTLSPLIQGQSSVSDNCPNPKCGTNSSTLMDT